MCGRGNRFGMGFGGANVGQRAGSVPIALIYLFRSKASRQQ